MQGFPGIAINQIGENIFIQLVSLNRNDFLSCHGKLKEDSREATEGMLWFIVTFYGTNLLGQIKYAN